MPTIYLDHNAIVGMAGTPSAADAEQQRQHALALKKRGYRYALSRWNIVELARSDDIYHIDQCCTFIEALEPVLISNPMKLKQQEVIRFLQTIYDGIGPVKSKPLTPFNESVVEMWASYGTGAALPNETFRESVLNLRSDPENIENIVRATKATPEAIRVGREAYNGGIFKMLKHITDREYMFSFLPHATPPEKFDYLEKHYKQVLKACPTVAAEEEMNLRRLKESFNPEPNDAIDLQHALSALPYCDYFVTGDRNLHEQCRVAAQRMRSGTNCAVVRNILQIATIV